MRNYTDWIGISPLRMRSRDNNDADRRPASGAGSSDESNRIRKIEEPKAPVTMLSFSSYLNYFSFSMNKYIVIAVLFYLG